MTKKIEELKQEWINAHAEADDAYETWIEAKQAWIEAKQAWIEAKQAWIEAKQATCSAYHLWQEALEEEDYNEKDS